MPEKTENRFAAEMFRSSHLLILIVYTVMSAGLTAAALLFSWELWALLIVLAGVISCWGLHLTQTFPAKVRIGIYSFLILLSIFYYGIHPAGMFDLAPLITVTMMLFTMTDLLPMEHCCFGTFAAAMLYDTVQLRQTAGAIAAPTVLRILLHILLVTAAWRVGCIIIRKHRQSFAEAERQIDALTDTARRMDDFLANVSHEIRTPINAVIGLTSIMLKRDQTPEQKRELLSVEAAGFRVTEQISDILDYTEIDMNKLTVSRETYILASVINDISAKVQSDAAKDIEVIFDIDISVPAVLIGDPAKIRKVLWHLVSNGIKFTRQGGVYVRIESAAQEYGVNLRIRVTDTGIGMTEEEKEMALDMIYQVGSGSSRRSGGLGLGLKIVQGAIRAMGGFLTVESTPDAGSVFTAAIPQGVSDESRCITLGSRDDMCIATFLRFSGIESGQVREYYRQLIGGLASSLGVPLYSVNELSDFLKLQKHYHISHLFIGVREYEDNQEYMEDLAKSMTVTVAAPEGFALPENSRIRLLRKPLTSFQIAALLNTTSGAAADAQEEKADSLFCPDVRAMVVDDERMNLIVAEGILRNYGMQITKANSGPAALRLCEEQDFDLIFMDHMMPDMDGVEAMKLIRAADAARGHETIMIALTANAVSSARRMFLAEGFDGFVSKPIEIADLERTLRRLLPKHLLRSRQDAEPVITESAPPEVTEAAEVPEPQPEPEAVPAADPMTILREAGIHADAGLEYCQNDMDFYRDLLREFTGSADEKIAEIVKFRQAGDWKNYAIRVHGLKSTSKMLGADALSELAKTLEFAAKDEDTDAVAQTHDRMLECFAQTVAAIRQALGEAEPAPAEDIPAADPMTILREAGIHADAGLEYCQNDMEFYGELIREFCGSADEKRAEIVKFRQAEDWKNYAIRVHG
ncbi:MAG TPA: hypothetical protein DCP68_00465, partial [Ruminococcus sp.]|nr:hypothetical protein [Ruminococcus sp.]